MEFSILTYNVLYNRASFRLGEIILKCKPDIICLQEIDTDEGNLKQIEKFGYKLADYSNSFFRFDKIFGIATFYNSDTLRATDSVTFPLPRSVYEFILVILRVLKGGNKPRTVLKTDFICKKNRMKLAVYNIHLTVVATNQGRVKHIRKIIDFVNNHKNTPTIIAGDFNYFPYSRKQLEELMKHHGFIEATKKLDYTTEMTSSGKMEQYNFVQRIFSKIIQKIFTNRLKLDYIFYKNLKLHQTRRIDISISDHYPIVAKFEI